MTHVAQRRADLTAELMKAEQILSEANVVEQTPTCVQAGRTGRKSQSNYSALHLALLSLHPSLSLLSLNTFRFFPSFPPLSLAEKIRNAGTHCHSRLLPPPLTPLALDKHGRLQRRAQSWAERR